MINVGDIYTPISINTILQWFRCEGILNMETFDKIVISRVSEHICSVCTSKYRIVFKTLDGKDHFTTDENFLSLFKLLEDAHGRIPPNAYP